MRKTFKIIYITMAACLLLLMACQKDDEKQAVQQTGTGTFKVSTITFDQFKTNAKAIQQLEKAAGNNTKDIIDNGKSFFYDDSRVTQIIYGDITTYSFEIHRYDKETDLLENLVIRQKSNGETESFIMEYTLNPQEKRDIISGKQVTDLNRKIMLKLDNADPYYGGVYHRADGSCYIYTWYDEDGNYGMERQKDVKCPEGYDDFRIVADGNQSGGGNNGGNNGGGGNNNSGGSISNPVNISVLYPPRPDGYIVPGSGTLPGAGGNPKPSFTPVITQPVINPFYNQFKEGLTTAELRWLKGNPLTDLDFISVLWGEIDTSGARIEFANKLLDFMMINDSNMLAGIKILDYLEKNDSLPESIQIAEKMMEAIEEYNLLYTNPDQNLIIDLLDKITNPENLNEPEVEIVTPPSCESFNFANTSSNWQEAAVVNINFTVVIVSPQGMSVNIVQEYPQPILFGCPRNLLIGNTQITSGMAASLSARALKLSMNETVKKYGNKSVTSMLIRLFFESRLKHNYPLFIPGGRVNFNSGNTNVIPTQYQTNAFGTGDCD